MFKPISVLTIITIVASILAVFGGMLDLLDPSRSVLNELAAHSFVINSLLFSGIIFLAFSSSFIFLNSALYFARAKVQNLEMQVLDPTR